MGVQSKGLFYNPGTARMQVSHLNNSRNPAFVSVLEHLALHGNVRGQGDRHDKGREKKKKVSVSVADSYQEVLSSSVPHFWTPRYLDCTLMRIMKLCMMNVSPARKDKKKKKKKSTCVSVSVCLTFPNLSSIKIRAEQQLPKSAGLQLLFSCLVICQPLPELCLFARHAIP